MEETEKMTALKKAYAEIILNTAKEAAARIMVSERKAHQLHHDLSSTKDEALRLLLRLKQTMDSKINEAEMKSINQQRRIEELEAQLQEAEDIVSNLRVELNEAHTKLEVMANNQMHSQSMLVEKAVCDEETEQPENGLPEAVLAAQTNSLSDVANVHSFVNNSLEKYGYSGDPDVPSIIMRSKEPELYRNGCTQRIRACEGNVINGHLSLSAELDDLKNQKSIREDKEGQRMHVTPSIGSDLTCVVGKKSVDIKEVKNVEQSSCKAQAFRSFRKKRKRAARHRRTNASTLKPAPFLAKEALLDLPKSETCLADSADIHESIDNEGNNNQLHSPSTAPSDVPDMGALSELVAVSRGDDKFTKDHTHVANEDREVASSLVLIRQQSDSGDCLDVPSSNQELELKNSSMVKSDAKMLENGNSFPSPPPKERVLKYTFQRKRKKECLSSDDSSFLRQENPSKRKIVKKQNGNLEPPKSSAVAESSRDSRRMAQVARQLISLSEKKWWK